MNKTTNYQLSQWDPDDKVLRTDFNTDNARIDAALKVNADAISAETSARISAVQSEASARAAAVSAEASARTSAVQAARDACPLVLLRSATLTSAVSRYDLSLTGFDWDAYGEILIFALLKNGNTKVLLNNLTGTQYYYSYFASGPTETFKTVDNPCSVKCTILRADRGFRVLWEESNNAVGENVLYFRETSTLRSDFKTMNFVGDLLAGTKFTILGIRG